MGDKEGRRANIEVGDEEVQTIWCEISYKDMLYNTRNTANIFNSYKWNITFKNVNHYVVHLKLT